MLKAKKEGAKLNNSTELQPKCIQVHVRYRYLRVRGVSVAPRLEYSMDMLRRPSWLGIANGRGLLPWLSGVVAERTLGRSNIELRTKWSLL